MQCLFCGKELALLKRLRGGAEFCSEAHRKEYQEQYEQLALARLMQAKPRPEPAAPLGRPSAAVEEAPTYESDAAETPDPDWQESQVEVRATGTLVETPVASKPAVRKSADDSDPAPLAGFLSEPMVPAVTPFEHAGLIESESAMASVATLPTLRTFASTDSAASASSGLQEGPPPASRVPLEVSMQVLDHHTRTSERGVEVREFAGPAPLMELRLRPGAGTEPAGAADVMEIVMLPHPPQKAKSWLGVPRAFSAAPAELGDLARLDFATTGFVHSGSFAYSDGPAAATPIAEPEAAPRVVPQAAPPVVAPVVPPVAPVVPQASSVPENVAAPESAESAPPALVTKALPVTLHGMAAQRGKLTQPFASIAAASDVQTPPSTALPLRPTIVFGPAPAPAPPSSQPAPAQPKPIQAKPAQPRAEESFRSSVVPPPKAVPVKRNVAPEPAFQERVQEKAPEKKAPKVAGPPARAAEPRFEARVEPRVEARVEPSKEAFASQSRESAAQSDEMPSLRMEATESAWSKLSTTVKIGVAAALVVVVAGIGYVVTRGNKPSEAPAAVTSTPSVAAGVPISGGWIDDWANASRTNRHISMLSGSAKLSDYRLEFQSQIETKAIGWIFRGLNPRNYYVAKIETIKPGLEPTVALVHFAVVDGQDDSRVVVPLPMKVRVDTTYKIRFDVVGNHFTAWVLGQKVAEWSDSRFGSGGVGFFSERDEHALLQGQVNVVALVPKN